MIFRAFIVWLLIGGGEVLQGVLRVKMLNRRVGDHHARQIGVAIGAVYILALAWLFMPWIGVYTVSQAVGVGLLWLTLMLSLDIVFGTLVFRFSWTRIAADFNPRRGGLLGFGMLIIAASPLIAAWGRGLI
jgi:hypothetical protein